MTLACASAGGTLRLTIGGTVYPVRGSATVKPSKFDIGYGANMDGSLYTTYKPEPVECSFTVSDAAGLNIRSIQANQCTAATLELDAVGRTYIMVDACIVGRPELNVENGEISNVMLVASDARELNLENPDLNF